MGGISVIICCYNSSIRLPETLKYLAKQKLLSSFEREVIVVDNASTDSTAQIASQEWEKYHLADVPLKVVYEARPGLNNARQRGALTAKYDLLLFCDDDNWLDEHYLENLFRLSRLHSDLGIIGAGTAQGVYEIPPPKWFSRFKHLCAIFEEDVPSMIGYKVQDDVTCCGAGMAVRKKLLLEYFKEQNEGQMILGRTGESLLSGEDTDINFYLLNKGYGVGKFEELSFLHFMPKGRINKQYIAKLAYSISYSTILVQDKNNVPIGRWTGLGFLKYLLINLLKGFFSFQVRIIQFRGQQDALAFISKQRSKQLPGNLEGSHKLSIENI